MKNSKWALICAALALFTVAVAGCGSDNDNPAAVQAIDTAPPVLPTGLSVSFADAAHQAYLQWDANTVDADLAGYLVTRSTYTETVELVTTPQVETAFVDTVADLGPEVTYYVYSVDTTGNVSAAAAVTLQLGGHKDGPVLLGM